MTATLWHRGPDDCGQWFDASSGIALGHRRLSIVDLSVSGHQPMSSSSGRFVLAYNGEIYNHQELRRELAAAGTKFRGTSDTEVLLAAMDRWGVRKTLARCNGMFAFAVWDVREKRLLLARDRIGIKPLYYGWSGDTLLFGSELKAIRRFPQFRGEICRNALALFLQHNYIPAPHSIYQGVFKLPAGTLLEISAASGRTSPKPERYWDLGEIVQRGCENRFVGNEVEAVTALEERLAEAVRIRMRADVPLGAFLSGGIDSTAVVALMQRQHRQPIQTFCIGFEEETYDESGYALAVARHLGTDHKTLVVTSKEAQDVIPMLPRLYDEPFADSSQIPTYLVSRLARERVTVSLSGDGGDELFGGYTRYAAVDSIWKTLGWLPAPLGRLGAKVLQATNTRIPLPRRVHTLSRFLSARSPSELYARFHCHWKQPEHLVKGGVLPMTLADRAPAATGLCAQEAMAFIDTDTYLPDDILVKLDRASMAVGLEARVPLLDHHLVEFAWTLPVHYRVRGGRSKWILRELVDRHVPSRLMERRKVGFGVPIDSWLRGPLKDWGEALLDEQRLEQEGYFRSGPIRRKWHEHLTGQQDWHYYLWDVLMFQAWLESVG